MYHLYHIPGVKIGVAENLEYRMKRQGYKPTDYDILMVSESLDEISKQETLFQKKYSYKKDKDTYKQLKLRMELYITETTTTFPCPLNKLKGRLMDMLGVKWDTQLGTFEVNEETIPWIMKNANASMYTSEKCYIYNRAFYEKFINKEQTKLDLKEENLFEAIRDWARHRGIYEKGDLKTQYVKLAEEFGELGKAILNNDHIETVDAIGDMIVVLTNLAHLEGTKVENCIEAAYNVIKQRSGKMINGTFVKDAK